jgi:catechol 2,3-dioxygenase-like lactoylglutathione lyase family enzyme
MISFPGTQVRCMLPVKNLDRARRFYEAALGLEALGARADGTFAFRCGGTEIALIPKPEGTKAQHTALGFRVDDVESAIAVLSKRGVTFADYDFPGLKTVNHVCVVGTEKAAWFEDPEGNILCLHQDLA